MRWLQSHTPFDEHQQRRVCSASARGGHSPMLHLLEDTVAISSWDHTSLSAAASEGHPEVVRWLRSLTPPTPWDTTSLAKALPYMDFDEVQQLCNQEPGLFSPKLCAAVACGNLGGRGSNLAVLKLLRKLQPPCPWDGVACRAAVKKGDIPMHLWARNQVPPCPWDPAHAEAHFLRLMTLGETALLEQFWPQGSRGSTSWSWQTMSTRASRAAMYGQLQTLQWLLARWGRLHYVPEGQLITEALRGGPCTNECWGRKHLCITAAENDHTEVVEWLLAQGCRFAWSSENLGVLENSSTNASGRCLLALARCGCQLPPGLRARAQDYVWARCTVQGLARWASNVITRSSAGLPDAQKNLDGEAEGLDGRGWNGLLMQLTRLPLDIVDKIAAQAIPY